MKTQSTYTTTIRLHIVIVCLLFALVLSACNSYDPKTQQLADALGATPSNTMANLKLTSNITDHYQWIYFKVTGELTNDIVERAVKSIDSGATVRPGASLTYAGSLGDTLTMSWSKADPKNLRVIPGKDMFRDAVQNKSWLINWSVTRDPKIADIYVYFVEYSATKMALEVDGYPITSPIIMIKTGRQ